MIEIRMQNTKCSQTVVSTKIDIPLQEKSCPLYENPFHLPKEIVRIQCLHLSLELN